VYGPFINEELVGEALEPFRGQVVIAPSSDSNMIPIKDRYPVPAWIAAQSRSSGLRRPRSSDFELRLSICSINTGLIRRCPSQM
jgi:hypothetical protein